MLIANHVERGLSRMFNFRKLCVQQFYEGGRISVAAYAGKDNIDSFGVCS